MFYFQGKNKDHRRVIRELLEYIKKTLGAVVSVCGQMTMVITLGNLALKTRFEGFGKNGEHAPSPIPKCDKLEFNLTPNLNTVDKWQVVSTDKQKNADNASITENRFM